jgi:hypothetical protein
VHSLCQTYHRLINHLGRTRWYSLVTRLKWKLDSVCLEIVLILTQDRCTVCAERTTSSEIILDTPDGTQSLLGHVESRFGPFADSVNVDSDAPDGTPR